MKSKSKHSFFFKGVVLAVAFALTVLCFPMEAILTLAAGGEGEVDYHYLTISGEENTLKSGITAGGVYDIPDAYIGGDEEWVVGDQSKVNQQLSTSESVTLKKSNVKVTYYNGQVITSSDDKETEASQNEGGRAKYDGTFKAENVGAYKITYTYTYADDAGHEITNSYELDVISSLARASVNFDAPNVSLVASSDKNSVIDFSLDKAKYSSGDNEGKEENNGKLKNVNILLPEILDEDGEEVKDVKFVANERPAAGAEAAKKVVVISAYGGNGARDVNISGDETNGFYIDSETIFKNTQYGDGTYTIKFDYYVLSNNNEKYQFVASNTKAFSVYGTSKGRDDKTNTYYKNYALDIALESTWTDNGETGIEKSIPKPIGVTNADSEPASEQVDVAYSVKVRYRKQNSDAWTELKDVKAADGETLLYADVLNLENEDDAFAYGSLKDPANFKPLQDGFYSFIYTVKDFYGNTKSNGSTAYEYRGTNDAGITDKTRPTPIVYDASVKTEKYEDIKDEEYKSQTYSSTNSVVVYAIGMTDNHSKHDDEGVTMYRRIENDEGVYQFTIEDYDEYNLIFNYRGHSDLITNNFNIRQQTRKLATEKTINSDDKMLAWLVGNGDYAEISNGGYRIVIDNANAEAIFGLFTTTLQGSDTSLASADAAAFKTFLTKERTSDADKAAFEAYKTKLLDLGFAYIDVDKTFGADGENGFGRDTFRIQYVVKDAAKNEASKDVLMTIRTSADDPTAPEITFKSSLKSTYLPTDVVTFDAPTSTDNLDSYLYERVLYRYLDSEDKPVALKKAEEGADLRETVDLTELWGDMTNKTYINGVLATEKYSDFHFIDEPNKGKDGYYEITDPSLSVYEIDLNELKLASEPAKTAVKLQVVTFVYDDAGNAMIYATSADIADQIDTKKPIIGAVEESETTSYYEGDTIELQKLEFYDDAVDFMNYEVKVTALYNGTTTVIDSVEGGRQVRDAANSKYTIYPGSFAALAGENRVVIKVSDKNGNSIVYFQTFVAQPRFSMQDPVIDKEILPEYRQIELEGDEDYDPEKGIELPTPTISYEIPNSVTWDVYNKNTQSKAKYDADADNYKYVIMGVKENGAASDYTVSQGEEKNKFTPKTVGTYEITYEVRVKIFDFHKFKYVPATAYDGENAPEEEHLELISATGKAVGTKVTFGENNTVYVDTTSDGSYIVTVDNSGIVIKKDVMDTPVVSESEYSSTMFGEEGVLDAFKSLRNLVFTKGPYVVDVVDNQGPQLDEYPYRDLSKEWIADHENQMTVYGIHPIHKAGINDIDQSKCSITVSYTLASGLPSGGDVTYEGADAFVDHVYEFPTVGDGTYKITYKVVDIRGNETNRVFSIAVGDTTAPTMIFPDNFVESSYEIGKTTQIKIDLNTIDFIDVGVDALEEGAFTYQPKATLRNTSTGETIEPTEESEGLVYYFPLDAVGSYTLTIEVEDAVGNVAREVRTFEVVSRTADTAVTYQVIGTVLIVISVLVLAGVIIYFIVSKVKLDKELKK